MTVDLYAVDTGFDNDSLFVLFVTRLDNAADSLQLGGKVDVAFADTCDYSVVVNGLAVGGLGGDVVAVVSVDGGGGGGGRRSRHTTYFIPAGFDQVARLRPKFPTSSRSNSKTDVPVKVKQ